LISPEGKTMARISKLSFACFGYSNPPLGLNRPVVTSTRRSEPFLRIAISQEHDGFMDLKTSYPLSVRSIVTRISETAPRFAGAIKVGRNGFFSWYRSLAARVAHSVEQYLAILFLRRRSLNASPQRGHRFFPSNPVVSM